MKNNYKTEITTAKRRNYLSPPTNFSNDGAGGGGILYLSEMVAPRAVMS